MSDARSAACQIGGRLLRIRRRVDATPDRLTAQEIQIAQLADKGLSNPEIARRRRDRRAPARGQRRVRRRVIEDSPFAAWICPLTWRGSRGAA
jgi:hypothetical protein